jgi:serine/threonine protein kinase
MADDQHTSDPGGGDQPGQPLGSGYLLHQPLGAGAMGQVWRGSTRDGQPVAVKVLRPELSSDPAVVARFVQEAQILTRLDDPHLVRVRDLVAEGARLGIVMDLVDGPDLRAELTRRGTFRPIDAAEITDGVLAGLAAVHAGNVVHRDIKPENVLLAGGLPSGTRLTDFGVARIAEVSAGPRRTTVIGTPEYLAPEVADGAEPTPASDLYAVGVMLYELVAGVTPFAGGSPLAVLRRHVEQQPVRPEGMPEGIWQLVRTLLAKDPGQRPASAVEARAALTAAAPSFAEAPALEPLTAPPAPTVVSQPTVMGLRADTPAGESAAESRRPPERSRRRGLLFGLAALLVVLVAAVVAVVISQRPDAASADAAGIAATTSASSSNRSTSSRSTSSSRTSSTSASNETVPAVTGLSLSAAQTALSNAGFRVVTTEVLDDSVTDNTVTAQDPLEGTSLDRGDEVTLTVARRPVGVFLSTLSTVQSANAYGNNGAAARVNGTTYVHPVVSTVDCDRPVSLQYDLGRHYRTFDTTAGVTDDSNASGVVQFDVFVDGRSVFSQTGTLGGPVPLSVDVTGGLRLEITATRVEADCDSFYSTDVVAVWADAQLFGTPGEVPTPTASPTS